MRIVIFSNTLSDSDMVYNGFALPYLARYQVRYVTYFPPELSPDPRLEVRVGGSVWSTLRAIRQAVTGGEVVHVHSPHMAAALVLSGAWPDCWRRTVYTVHTSYPNLKPRNRLMTLLAFVALRRIVFCSYASRDSFPRWIRALVQGRAAVVRNGVDMARIDRVLEGACSG